MEEIIEENATFLWESCATAIKSQVSEVVWQVTFSSVIPIEIKNDQLVLQVPSTVVRDRIEGRYKKLVSETLSEISDDQFNIAVNVVTEPISQNLEEFDAKEETDDGFVLQKIEEFEDDLIIRNLEEKEESKLVNNVSLTQDAVS